MAFAVCGDAEFRGPAVQRPLTDVFVRSARPPAVGRVEISDIRCAGLVLRIAADGGKSWSFRFRTKTGKQTRATIGRYPEIGLTVARASADAMRRAVAEGVDPVEQKRAARAGQREGTFDGLAERYLAEHSRRHKRSSPADERNLRKHVLPRWRGRRFATIKRADVIELVERLVTDGKPTLANRVQSLISSIFTFAMDSALVEANPCHRLKKRGVENVGRRVLSDGEIRLFWNGIIKPPASRRIGLGLRLALLTGARVGEVAGLARGELDGLADAARSIWIIPGARTKNGKDHLIPLPPVARNTILELLDIIEPGEEYLFPTRSQRRRGPMWANSLTQCMANFGGRLKGHEEPIRTWTADAPSPHDLRRTVGTRLAELRVPKEIRDRVLNHAAGDVGSKHYNLHDYADEKREALTRWSLALTAIVNGAAVTVLPLAVRIGGRGNAA
jgi:integrase